MTYRNFLTASVLAAFCLVGSKADAATISLGTFNFDSNLFGNTLLESDGGTFSASNWLNILNADPGNPGYLTGANFDTGIANIGISGSPIYEIGYSTAIVNGAGNDFAIVDSSYSTADTYSIAVSTDGTTFTGFLPFLESIGTDTGVIRNYFYGGGGPFSATLNVISLDLSAFGIAPGGSIVAVRISGSPQADLIRVAGFATEQTAVPEPATLLLLGAGLGAVAARRRLKKRA